MRQIGPHLDQARAVEAIDQQTMAMSATLKAQTTRDLTLLDQGPTLDELRELPQPGARLVGLEFKYDHRR